MSGIGRILSSRHILALGERMLAWLGLGAVAVVVTTVAAIFYLSQQTLDEVVDASREHHFAETTQLLAASTQRLLLADQLSSARALLVDAANRHQFDHATLTGPGEKTLAHTTPHEIDADLASIEWADVASSETTTAFVEARHGRLIARHPLHLPGRGVLMLEVEAASDAWGSRSAAVPAGVGLAGSAALLAMLLLYRAARTRLAAIGIIHESLQQIAAGEQAESALKVDHAAGAEADAWNNLLDNNIELRQKLALHQAQEVRGGANQDHSLTSGCDAIPQGLMLVDDQGRVQYANHALGLYFHRDRTEIVGRDVSRIVDEPELAEMIARMCAGEIQRRATHDIDRQEHEAGVIRAALHPINRGDCQHVMVVIEDVTQQRVAETSRHAFVAQATHELRAPLTNIRLYLETAQDDGQTDPQLLGQCLNVINQETHRLERMVGDMLSVAEIEAGSLRIDHDHVRIDTLLKDTCAEYEAQARDKSVTLELDLPPKLPFVNGDRDKLILAVQNLVGNAIKYTPTGGRVSVTAELDASTLAITVTDTGLGIPETDLPRIFDKFYRAQDERISDIKGSGLGLGLAREVVRLHGGDITVESQIDRGSTFTLTLPVEADATAATDE